MQPSGPPPLDSSAQYLCTQCAQMNTRRLSVRSYCCQVVHFRISRLLLSAQHSAFDSIQFNSSRSLEREALAAKSRCQLDSVLFPFAHSSPVPSRESRPSVFIDTDCDCSSALADIYRSVLNCTVLFCSVRYSATAVGQRNRGEEIEGETCSRPPVEWRGGLRRAVCDFKVGALLESRALDWRRASVPLHFQLRHSLLTLEPMLRRRSRSRTP